MYKDMRTLVGESSGEGLADGHGEWVEVDVGRLDTSCRIRDPDLFHGFIYRTCDRPVIYDGTVERRPF
jgi:hypothetical protein